MSEGLATTSLGRWLIALDGRSLPPRELIGGKAWSIARMLGLGLPVPPAFVIGTRACTAYLETGAAPHELHAELRTGIQWLEAQTGRSFGAGPLPLLVSVRSGAAVSMPGMMDTVLNLGITYETEAALAAECGDAGFARDTHRRFLELFGSIVMHAGASELDRSQAPRRWRESLEAAAGNAVPGNVFEQLELAVQAVFDSWNSRRARRYRKHHEIPDSLGTAVTVQAMVFGNLDARSGTGVLFSRKPLSGEPLPYGEYLQGAQGEDVVSGKFTPQPLKEMRELVPQAYEELLKAAAVLERSGRDVQDIEFTVERGRLHLLQARPAKRAPAAAVRTAVDMAREGLIDVDTALGRVSCEQVNTLLSPRLADGAAEKAVLCAKGESACPGIASGVVVTDPDEAERRAAAGEAIILARDTTSPNDLHGMIAARAVITEQGGSTSHAAVVSRALGRPCIVGCGDGSALPWAGKWVTVDGEAGRVYEGRLEIVDACGAADPWLAQLERWAEERAKIKVLERPPTQREGLLEFTNIVSLEQALWMEEQVRRTPSACGIKCDARSARTALKVTVANKLDYVVTSPRLPLLLMAAQLALGAGIE